MVKLVSGRLSDQASLHETLASYTLQRDYGIGPGTVIRLPMAAASRWGAALKAMAGGPVPKPAGPAIALRVVGIAAAEGEFPSGQGSTYDLYPTQAFAAATRGTPALPFYYVRLRHGQADFARLDAAARGLDGVGVQNLDAAAAAITASIRRQPAGWWVLAALAVLAAAVQPGQALARQTAAENTDQPARSALGLALRQPNESCDEPTSTSGRAAANASDDWPGHGLGRSRPALARDYQAALGCAPSITGGWAVVTGIKWPVVRFISSRWPGWK
jgi:hypothetical protein